jgi:3'-5' exoribonuclease
MENTKKQFIDQLVHSGMNVDSNFAAGRVDFREKANGDAFLLFSIKDSTGELGGVLWEVPPVLKENLKTGNVIQVTGMTQEDSKYGLQVKADTIRILDPSEYNAKDYLPVSKHPLPQMEQEIKDHIGQIQDASLKEFMTSWILNPAFLKVFMNATAAKKVHHACVGGLAEHTLEVVKMGLDMARHYPEINKDIVIAGALVHDIGKIKDYEMGTTIEMTDDGRLFNHIPLGFAMIRYAANEQGKLNEPYIKHLCHIILSHHGSSDKGSTVEPRTMESITVHLADYASGTLGFYDTVLSGEMDGDSDWTKKNFMLGMQLYKGFK